MNTNDVNYKDPGFFSLLKGASGAGKSVGALSFPQPYVFDFDHKMPWIARKHFPGKSIEYDTYTDIGDVFDMVNPWLTGEKECPYETLIYDSLTHFATISMNSTAKAKGEDIMRLVNSLIPRKGGKGSPIIEALSYDYYNNEVRFFEWLLGANKVIWTRPGNPKNILFTAHIIESKSKPNIETKLVTVTRSIVAVGNKAPAIVPGFFDEVYLFGTYPGEGSTARVQHIMTTETTGEDDAKTAFKLDQIIDFTNKNLYDILKAQIAGSEMFI